MKKAILFLLALIVLSAVTNAQKAFEDGTKLINAGVGLWLYDYGFTTGLGSSSRNSPVFCVSYEQSYRKAGPGIIGVGGFITYQSSFYRNTNNSYLGTNYYYEHRYRSFVAAARAVYHWDVLNWENAEVYGGAIAGLRFQTYSYSSDIPEAAAPSFRHRTGTIVRSVASLFVGARWYFAPNFAVYAETSGGYGLPYLSGGITFKL